MELKTYKHRVREILKKSKTARNSDAILYARYIHRFYPHLVTTDKNGRPAVLLEDFKKLPGAENVRRLRQVIQNDNGEYMPTDKKVIKMRRIKEENWRNAEVREAKNA